MIKWIKNLFLRTKMAYITMIDASELADYTLVGHLIAFVDGKVTAQEIIGASRHPRMRIKAAFAQLTEVPDSSADTITVKIINGSTDMSDTLTFTEATETKGDFKKFTLVSNQDVVASADAITVTTAGTTTTAGEVVLHLDFENTH